MTRAVVPRRGPGRPGYDLESLLAVAVGVFNQRGYDGTSMEDLSRRLGISKSAIYHHVVSKEELLSLALDRALDGLFEVAEPIAATLDVEHVTVVQQSIEDGGGEDLVAGEHLGPVADALVGGDQDAAALVAVAHHREE